MKFKENRPLAYILVALALILTLLISTKTKLVSKADKVMVLFHEEIGYDLNTKSAYADNLAGIASRYLDRNDALFANMSEARDTLLEAKTPKESFRASAKVTDVAANFYDKLGVLELSQADDRLRRSNYADILAIDDILRRSDFNKKVETFNKELDAFPAIFLRQIVGIEKIDYFR